MAGIHGKKLLKDAFVYTATSGIQKSIPFLLLPILTRVLSPHDYGLVGIFQVLVHISGILVGLRVHGAIGVSYFWLDECEFKEYVFNALLVIGISFVSVFSVVLFAKGFISSVLLFPADWLMLALVAGLSTGIIEVTISIWQTERKPLSYGLFQISRTSVNSGFSLFFVLVLGMAWEGRAFGILGSAVLFSIVGLLILLNNNRLRVKISKKHIKDIFKFSIPLLPATLGWWVVTGIDRMFISAMLNVSETGLYTVGYQIGLIVSIFVTSFNAAWWPFLFSKLKNRDFATKRKLVKFTYFYDVIVICIALIVALLGPVLLKYMVGKAFFASGKFILWISIGYAFNGMRYMILNYIYYAKKTHVTSFIPFVIAGINIVLNYFLIKLNGGVGAAQATAVSFFAGFILTWIASARVFPMPWFGTARF